LIGSFATAYTNPSSSTASWQTSRNTG
jgi:hypothetical protein